MDFSKNRVLKENYSFFVGNNDGFIANEEHGLYNRDTRFLSRYQWHFPEEVQTLLSHSLRPDTLEIHHADLHNHYQRLAVKRKLVISDVSFADTITLENTDMMDRNIELKLSFDADFSDLFEVRGWPKIERSVKRIVQDKTVSFSYIAQDDVSMLVEVNLSEDFELVGDILVIKIEVPAKTSKTLAVNIRFDNPFEKGSVNPVSYEQWRNQFAIHLDVPNYQPVLNQAVDDLRALLLFDEAGTLPAAGIPWFATAFGRDSLLTAYMMLPHAAWVAKGTLRYLARHQAKNLDEFRNAQPGKILHEMRFGELSRLGKTPHRPYYGTVDATSLFIRLLYEVFKLTKDLDFVKEMRAYWEAALEWMIVYGDLDDDGFLEFEAADPDKGLEVQSWKDSGDSMSHKDGSLAKGALAVSEVQGYAYAAYLAASDFYEALQEKEQAKRWRTRANELKEKFHDCYWLNDMQTYAMALDGDKKPLRVHNSDAGQLLWTGIVPEDIAPKLVKTLMSTTMWTGWGIRTLGKDEVRYNPVSYHNGSVWSHDTALIAGGMMRYGFKKEARRIMEATFDIAVSQSDMRLPELVAGYEHQNVPPVPYPTACRPQAWDAAALIYLAQMFH